MSPVLPLVILGTGLYLAWFGVHYFGSDTKFPTEPVKSVLTGKPIPAPSGQTTAAEIASGVSASPGVTPSTPAGTVASGSVIADAAQKYFGSGYVWGGPADRPGNWDCSSFVSYVLGHDLGISLPGGRYGDPGFPPHAHGPTTLNYMLFGTGVDLSKAQPGDLVVSVDHMGIVIGGGKMVSAQDPALGTGVSSYLSGFPGGTPVCRRVITSTGTSQSPGTNTAGGRG